MAAERHKRAQSNGKTLEVDGEDDADAGAQVAAVDECFNAFSDGAVAVMGADQHEPETVCKVPAEDS